MRLFYCVIATEFDYRIQQIQYNQFRVALHAVDSLNVKDELRSKEIKQFFSPFATRKSCFTFCMNCKGQGVVTSLDGINRPVDSDVTEGVITTRSNRMKFRLKRATLVLS